MILVVICKQYTNHLKPIYLLWVVYTLYTNRTSSMRQVPLEHDIAVNGCSGFTTSTQKGPFTAMFWYHALKALTSFQSALSDIHACCRVSLCCDFLQLLILQAKDKANRTESLTSIGSGGKKAEEAAVTEGKKLIDCQSKSSTYVKKPTFGHDFNISYTINSNLLKLIWISNDKDI